MIFNFLKKYMASFMVSASVFILAGAAWAGVDAFQVILATNYSAMKGVKIGGGVVGSIDNGDYLKYKSVDFGSGASGVTFDISVPTEYAGQNLEVRIDSLSGKKLGALTLQSTGGWMTFQAQAISISPVSGVHDLYLIGRGSYGVGNLKSFQFSSSDIGSLPSSNPSPAPVAAPNGLPDVVVASITTNPAQPVAGQPITYSVKITNQGTAATPAGTILGVAFLSSGGPDVWSDTYTSSLAPGASVTLTANGGEAGAASVSLSAGSHTVQAHVNDLARFAESNSTNNTKDYSFNVASSSSPSPSPAPTPAPSPTPAPAPAPSAGSTVPYFLSGEGDPNAYVLTFQDEFNGSSLDTSKWTDHAWYGNPSSTHDYEVSNGSLKMFPERNSSGKFEGRYLVTGGPGGGAFYQAYGYFEMEAKLPVGKGCWPAFWLLNSDDGPSTGAEPELDIMEAYSGDVGYWANDQMQSVLYEATIHQNGANQPNPGVEKSFQKGASDLSTAFHKYAMKWEPGKITFYFDGKAFASQAVNMSRKMYILLDLELNNGAGGNADSTTPTGPGNSFEIRYVRAWQSK